MVLNAGIHTRGPNVNDLLKAEQEFQLRKQLTQAQVESEKKKLTQVDVDKLGEQAFMKAAMGEPLSKEEQAAAMFIDAKSGGTSFNPVTGEVFQKPRISDKIGLPAMGGAAPMGGMPRSTPPIVEGQGGYSGGQELPPVFGGLAPPSNLSPKARTEMEKRNLESAITRLEGMQSGAGSASEAARAAQTMSDLLPDLGYTGTGGVAYGAIDKALTSAGLPNILKGDPAAREAFETEGVKAWVSAVEPLKGALTEQEGRRFDKAVSNLGTTPQGIEARAKLANALSDRAKEKSQFYEQYFMQRGNLLGADAEWEKYTKDRPFDAQSVIKGGAVDPVEESRRAILQQQGITGVSPQQRPDLQGDVQSLIDMYAR